MFASPQPFPFPEGVPPPEGLSENENLPLTKRILIPGIHEVYTLPDPLECRDEIAQRVEAQGLALELHGSALHRNLSRKVEKGVQKNGAELSLEAKLSLRDRLLLMIQLQADWSEDDKFSLRLKIVPPIIQPPQFTGQGLHFDKRSKRVICALIGPGYEWALPEEVSLPELNRVMNGHRSDKLLLEGAELKPLGEGDIACFQGDKLPHRSPFHLSRRLLCTVDSPSRF